jgi:alkanesulfonate monooxygenase SsuD/methylene tetrahydromethanopterin reductase-like flavin-dependent oxidoreductase (luciferase family)
MYVDETDEEASTWGTKLAYTFAHLAAHLVGISSVYPTPAYKTPGLLFSVRGGGDEKAPGGGGVIREGMAIGSPQTVIKNLKMWEEIGVDRMVLIINTGEVIPQERVLTSLRLFAEQVMPAFDRPGAMTVEISASELVEPAMP